MRINNLYFGYSAKNPIIKGLNLILSPGHIYGLLGQNGAGKTTLLKLITGLCFPNSGSIKVFGLTPRKRQPDFLQEIFFIPEDFNLPVLSIRKYAEYFGIFYPFFDESLFSSAVQKFDLNPNAILPHLSHGQRKLFLTAFALSTRAKLLILDEPSNGLDIVNKQIWQDLLLKEVSEEQTVLISTHQVHDIAHLIDSVLIMQAGKIQLNASLLELEGKLSFDLIKEEPVADSVFYAERRPGGYAILKANTGQSPSAIDLSLLFQAFLKNTQIAALFQGEQAHV